MEREQIIKALDILERFDFFQGQRAGRELWNEKPFDVQEQDIAKFSQDVAWLKNYIKELTEENESRKQTIDQLGKNNDEIARVYPLAIKEAEANTVRKMQKRLKAKAYTNNYCQDVVLLSNIDQIAKEMINNGEKEN